LASKGTTTKINKQKV